MVVHFCMSHLLMSYCFFGVTQKAHSAPSKQAILGFYNNLSIIDVRTTLSHLRYCLSFFMLIFSSTPSKCILVDSGEKGSYFQQELFTRLRRFKHDYVLDL